MLEAARFLFLVLRAALLLTLDVLSPPACAACDARVSRRTVFCASCVLTILPPDEDQARPAAAAPARSSAGRPARPPSTLRVIAFAAFGGAVAIALRRLKFAARPDLGRPLGDLARLAVRRADLRADVVIPVPLHPRRLVERGYNQSALIARAVAAELRVPLAARAVARVRGTARQAMLDREARFENVREAFRVRDATAVRGRRVILVDDVLTTGATMDACALALRDAGAASVTAVVVARAGVGDAGRDPITADEPGSAAHPRQARA